MPFDSIGFDQRMQKKEESEEEELRARQSSSRERRLDLTSLLCEVNE